MLWQPAEDSPHPSLVLTFPVAQEMLSRQRPGQEGPRTQAHTLLLQRPLAELQSLDR